jgi:adenylate cyclase
MAPDRTADRWEWRTFAPSLAELEVAVGSAAEVKPRESSEIYLVGGEDHLNLKIRDSVIELKVLEQTDEHGLELWRPVEKLAFPAEASDVRRLLDHFHVASPTEDMESLGDFLRWVLATGHFRAINVHKARRNFVLGGCPAEFAIIKVSGDAQQSFCIENVEREPLLGALRQLGLPSKRNTSFPRALRQNFRVLASPCTSQRSQNVEIERKFLVDQSKWRPKDSGTEFRQGYLSSAKDRIVRVRIAGGEGTLTIKGLTIGTVRSEFEYPIPAADAAMMLDRLCEKPLIEKTRHKEHVGDRMWEIDVFHGDNEGLTVAEVELVSKEEVVRPPDWILQEVSEDPRYFNSNLLKHPYRTWHATGGMPVS